MKQFMALFALLLTSFSYAQSVDPSQIRWSATPGSAIAGRPWTGVYDPVGNVYSARVPHIVSGMNVQEFGDSICAEAGSTSHANSWMGIVTAAISSGTITPFCVPGLTAGDIFNYSIQNRPLSPSIQGPAYYPQFNGQLVLGDAGTNDSNFSFALNANQDVHYKSVLTALLVGAAIPTQQKVLESNSTVTASGSVGRDNYYLSTFGRLITSAAGTVSFDVPVDSSGVLYLAYGVFATDSGSMTVTIDGVAATDTITSSATLFNYPFGGATLATGQGYTRTGAVARYTKVTPGLRHIVFRCVSPGTNGCSWLWAGTTPPNSPEYAGPTVAITGVIQQQNDTKATATAAYDGYNKAVASMLFDDGLNVFFIDVRRWYNGQVGPAMSSTYGIQGNGYTASDMTITSGSNQIKSATRLFGSGDSGKYVRCVGAGAAGADLWTTVQSYTTNSPNSLFLNASASTTISGTGVCSVGYLGDLYNPSTAPGLHPNDWGHMLLARATLATLQASSSAPPINFPNPPTFAQGFNVTTGTLNAPNSAALVNKIEQAAAYPSLNYSLATGAGAGAYGYVTGSDIQGQVVTYLGSSPTTGTLFQLTFSTIQPGLIRCGITQEGQTTWYGLFQNAANSNTTIAVSAVVSLSTASSPFVVDYNCTSQQANFSRLIVLGSFSIASNVLMLNTSNLFSVGDKFIINGATTGTYLNGQLFTITSRTTTQIQASFTHADVGTTTDTGFIVKAYN